MMLFSCKNDIKTIEALSFDDTIPMELTYDVKMMYSDSGKRQALLEGPLMRRVETKDDPYMEFPEGFEITLYDSVNQPKSIITAEYGIMYESNKQMEAKNNVVVRNLKNHEQLNTEQLIWDQKKRIIYSEVFVKITKPDEILFGDGLKSDEDFGFYEIKNPTGEFVVYPDDEKTN